MNALLLVSIGTTHPWNVAGTGLDARVSAEFGLRHATVVAAVSAQGPAASFALQSIDLDVLRAQFAALPEFANAYRIGALPTADAVRATAVFLRSRASLQCVVDPAFASSAGEPLASAGAIRATCEDLATLPAILTPNLNEASTLLGEPVARSSMAEAARALQRRGPRAVLLKGGHLEGDPADVLATATGVEEFQSPRLPGSMRGSGCVLAAALACHLAMGVELRDAVVRARAYVAQKIAGDHRFGDMQVAF